MCARYTLTLDQARLVMAGLVHIFAFAPRYNIGPAQRVPVILNSTEGVKAVEMRWGIRSGGDAPSLKGSGDASSPEYDLFQSSQVGESPSTTGRRGHHLRRGVAAMLHINAQAENIHKTTTFKPLLGQRCLVPMDGFYEWKPDKSPVRFVRRRELFCVAGLWKDVPRPRERERVVPALRNRVRVEGKNQTDAPVTERSFVLLTTAANPSVAPIHDRMPFIVRDDQFDQWLNNPDSQLPSSIFHLLDKNPLDFYAVSREVNNVRNESPDLVRPASIEKELF